MNEIISNIIKGRVLCKYIVTLSCQEQQGKKMTKKSYTNKHSLESAIPIYMQQSSMEREKVVENNNDKRREGNEKGALT